jgi:hypothetical protein
MKGIVFTEFDNTAVEKRFSREAAGPMPGLDNGVHHGALVRTMLRRRANDGRD